MFHIDFGMAPMFLSFHVQLLPQQCSYLSKQKQESETKLVILIITLGIIAFTFIWTFVLTFIQEIQLMQS